MANTNVYIADNKNLVLYKGNDFDGFTFTVLNTDETAYDFTGYTDVFLKIYTKKDRKVLLRTIPDAVAGVQIASNVITWNCTYLTDIDLNIDTYFYDLSYLDANGKLITVVFGDFIIT